MILKHIGLFFLIIIAGIMILSVFAFLYVLYGIALGINRLEVSLIK